MRNARIGQISIRNHQRIAGVTFGVCWLEQHGSGLGIDQQFTILGICQETDLTRAGLLQSGQPGDFDILVAT